MVTITNVTEEGSTRRGGYRRKAYKKKKSYKRKYSKKKKTKSYKPKYVMKMDKVHQGLVIEATKGNVPNSFFRAVIDAAFARKNGPLLTAQEQCRFDDITEQHQAKKMKLEDARPMETVQ